MYLQEKLKTGMIEELEVVKIELIDRSQLGDLQYYKNEYEWLLELNDDELSQTVIERNDVQNALIELLRFVDDVIDLPAIAKPQIEVGNTVYAITKYNSISDEEIIECKVTRMQHKNRFTFSVHGKYRNGNFYNANFTEKSIGKNVFLSREDAEGYGGK